MPKIKKGGAAPEVAPPDAPGTRVEVHEVEGGYVVLPEAEDGSDQAELASALAAVVQAAPESEPEEQYIPPPPVLHPPDLTKRPVTKINGGAHLWVSGFCQGEAQITGVLAAQMDPGSQGRMHAKCPGAVTSGNGTTTICGCPGHRDENRCHICGHANEGGEGYDADRRRCTDVEACADRLHAAAIASSNTPLGKMLREVRAASARPGAADPTSGLPQAASARRVGRPCQCGCALVTGGGLFRPGHDAKLKSTLQKAATGGDRGAVRELVARHWPLPPSVDVEGGDILTGEEANQAYINDRVAARYSEDTGEKE